MRNTVDENLIEKTIAFITKAYESKINSKPVLLHSIRVAMYLLENGADTELIVSALLHDVLEDTKTTFETIKLEFGKEIAETVLALTIKPSTDSYEEKYIKDFERLELFGLNAILIRAADIIDNSYYYHLGGDKIKDLVEKIIEFQRQFSDKINIEKIREDLELRADEVKKLL